VHSTIISAPNLLVLAVVAVYAIDVQPMILLVLPLLILLCQFALEWPHIGSDGHVGGVLPGTCAADLDCVTSPS